ncbi:MAG: serine--tRNA ligase [Candidatus Marinimicrobia bacterium]|nr:serine--tRNA ligase [Candidatus Neomarinimicrobiota bacterium]
MLSLQFIRKNQDMVLDALKSKKVILNLETILEIDTERRDLIRNVDDLKAKRNKVSQLISIKKKNNENSDEEIKNMRSVSENIKRLDDKLKKKLKKLNSLLLYIPNIFHNSVPSGLSEENNILVREWGKKPDQNKDYKDHVHLCDKLNLTDFSRASKMSGSAFPLYTNLGAKLERSLINFMLDYHIKQHGYSELMPPFLTNREATTTTGQLPKLEDDMYYIESDDLFCIPTAEVPVTNMYANEILRQDDLPLKHVAYSACFRREAGSYGKDTRGLLRVHQFNKVEMVNFVVPSQSYEFLEKLTKDAEDILQELNLHYRVISLCKGDISFAAAKCYDIEVWSPGEQKYLEVSSCSNFESFQARRGNIKYRCNKDQKVHFVHTLNGSGLATPRLMVALLETYQNDDGSISIPKVLQPYMGIDVIKK